MTVQAFLLLTSLQNDDVLAINDPESEVLLVPRLIDNSLANNLGAGTIAGTHYVVAARLLNDPDYTAYYALCSTFPIYTWDSDVLFLPDA